MGQKDMEDKTENLSLEEAFTELDGLLNQLNDRDVPLEEAFSLYERGTRLLRHCNGKLDTVEKKMQILNEEGELSEF